MTEEIIIDGVDVAGCEFLRNCIIPDNYGCKIDDSLCCDVGNCYYKQLKQAEIEIEKLKGVDGSVHPDSAYYKIRKLEEENERLKKKIINLTEEKGNLIINRNTLENKLQDTENAIKTKDKYESALKEIKSIVEYECANCEHPGDCHPLCDKFKIKNIISEVETR